MKETCLERARSPPCALYKLSLYYAKNRKEFCAALVSVKAVQRNMSRCGAKRKQVALRHPFYREKWYFGHFLVREQTAADISPDFSHSGVERSSGEPPAA